MSFLKKIFGSPKADIAKGTPLRDVLQEYTDRLPPPASRNAHNHCLTILAPILDFGCAGRTPVSDLSVYTSDTCLFELACYILASADFWTFKKAPNKREEIQQILFSQLDAISSRSGFLPEKAAYDYANSRVGLYGGIAANSLGVEGLHLRLKHALIEASTNSRPAKNLNSNAPSFGDPIAGLALTQALVDWDIVRLKQMDATLSAIIQN